MGTQQWMLLAVLAILGIALALGLFQAKRRKPVSNKVDESAFGQAERHVQERGIPATYRSHQE